MARCPECNARLTLPLKIEVWEHIFCNVCGAELEVVDKDPLELEVIYDFEEDDDVVDAFEDEDEDDLESWEPEEPSDEDEDGW